MFLFLLFFIFGYDYRNVYSLCGYFMTSRFGLDTLLHLRAVLFFPKKDELKSFVSYLHFRMRWNIFSQGAELVLLMIGNCYLLFKCVFAQNEHIRYLSPF